MDDRKQRPAVHNSSRAVEGFGCDFSVFCRVYSIDGLEMPTYVPYDAYAPRFELGFAFGAACTRLCAKALPYGRKKVGCES
jgi:hypothetical protein